MAIDITGFQRMRRQQAERKEAEEKCQKATAQSKKQTNTSQDASTPKAGAKPATQTKKKPSGRQQKK
jgi:uncharacterized protein (DUF305 family)